MPPKQASSTKRDSLRQHGTLNPDPATVTDALFQDVGFFDAEDLLQVKYEMLRSVHVDKRTVSHAAGFFGFSRPTFYQAQADFMESGLFGLLPDRPGPRRAHKLTVEVLTFVRQTRADHPSAGFNELAQAIQRRFGVVVHPRSIERRLARQEKKLH